ncbi:hypothetical protein H4582DRAFT_1309113 [Lactarius indigo]|nr:hypothetical protein H4582DRAFT_1309113 [Lactarius indigo]
MTINFVLLQSPLLSPHDPETVILSQELSADPSFPEILWNFSRYKGRARITLEQNPHFYLRCPADESAFTPKFRRLPLQDLSGVLENNATVYVLFDRPGRVFLTTERELRIFGNVWALNGSLIFRDRFGVLEGEKLVRSSSMRYNIRLHEELDVHQYLQTYSRLNHGFSRLSPTTLSMDRPVERTFRVGDWIVLSLPESYRIDVHVRGSREFTNSLGPPPPPPTRSGYGLRYTTMNVLNNDILLYIFDYYRLDEENGWNVRLGWCKLSHVCRRWRHIIYSSSSSLGMYIQCTNGTPRAEMLGHLPHLLLSVDYRYASATLSGQDESGIYHALLLRDRVRQIVLHLPSLLFHKFLMLMDGSFPVLEYLSISPTADEDAGLLLPKTFLAPNLSHLTLHGVGLPRGLSSLSSTISLVTLTLTNIQTSGYILPGQLVARLRTLPQLEDLSIGFSIPIPRPSAERELLGEQGPETLVTLPNLRLLTFQGVSAYLERFIAQIRSPLLERLNITLFNQIAFALPHLSRFTNITEGIKLSNAKVIFQRDVVSIITGHHSPQQYHRRFVLRVMCKQLDWQIDCAAQICSALMPVLPSVENLTLDFHKETIPTEFLNGGIDSTTWLELLGPFIWVKELRICGALLVELSRALQVDGVRFWILPSLQKIACEANGGNATNMFSSFLDARQVTGRPVLLSALPPKLFILTNDSYLADPMPFSPIWM